jgi:K+-transporting ATPase ATPase C chain
MRLSSWLTQHLAALRVLLVLTVLTGFAYPLTMTGIARLPGLDHQAGGSPVRVGDTMVGSRLVGQSFIGPDGHPLRRYFQSRPSAAGDGYDPTATGASNLGPEDVVDALPDPALVAAGTTDPRARRSLLTQVCTRSKAVGDLEGVDGRRPYCTPDGVGAVLAVFRREGVTGPVTRAVSLNQPCPATPFLAGYSGVPVECSRFGEDYSRGIVTPIRGPAPDHPAVPPDAVTASASGLDPHISPAYARLQAPRVAVARGVADAAVRRLIEKHTTSRTLGFLGEPTVNVVDLNLDLDRRYPTRQENP